MNCPRTITTRTGKQRVVRCRSWSCSTCAGHKRAQILAATRATFGGASIALRIRAQEDGAADDTDKVWARIRSRLPGMRYLAVREGAPDAHLHALCTHVDIALLRRSALASGALDVNVEPCRDRGAYIDYILDKRADLSAGRITHSRDLTAALTEPYHAEETEDQEKARRWKERTGYPEPDFRGAAAASETETQTADRPRAPSPAQAAPTEAVETEGEARAQARARTARAFATLEGAADALSHAESERRIAVHTLMEAAMLAGAQITITMTIQPLTVQGSG